MRPSEKYSERRHGQRPSTFAEIRRDAEKKLARGLKLDFDQIMLDIEAIRVSAKKPGKT
jgi:hypothetical protein